MQELNFVPWRDQIVVKPDTHRGVIQLVGDVGTTRGTVVAVGENCKFYEVGDIIRYRATAGVWLDLEEPEKKSHLLMGEFEPFGKLIYDDKDEDVRDNEESQESRPS